MPNVPALVLSVAAARYACIAREKYQLQNRDSLLAYTMGIGLSAANIGDTRLECRSERPELPLEVQVSWNVFAADPSHVRHRLFTVTPEECEAYIEELTKWQ